MRAARSWPRPAWRPARQPAAMRQEQPGNPSDAHTGREHPSARSASAASTAYRSAPHPYRPILATCGPVPQAAHHIPRARSRHQYFSNQRPTAQAFPGSRTGQPPCSRVVTAPPRSARQLPASWQLICVWHQLGVQPRRETVPPGHVTEAGPESATSRCLSGTGLRAPDGPRIEVPRRPVTMARRRRPSPGEYGDDSTTGLGRTPISRPAFQQPAYQPRPRTPSPVPQQIVPYARSLRAPTSTPAGHRSAGLRARPGAQRRSPIVSGNSRKCDAERSIHG